MGILKDFERRLEGAVEGFFARAFRSGLQPVELAKAVQRYAGNYQQVGVDGVFVPNVYRFLLSPDDMERFSGFEASLREELAEVVRRTADDKGWQLKGGVRIELRPHDSIRVGTYELRGKVESPPPRASRPSPTPPPVSSAMAAAGPGPVPAPRAGAAGAEATTVLPAGRATASLIRLGGPESGTRHPLVGSGGIVGRLPECAVTIEDPSVSRRHARITSRDGQWTVEDLNSTNGVRVNGETVTHATLQDGDRLELGAVRLAFAVEP